MFPLDYASDPLVQKSLSGYLHTVSGGVFFLTLACYSLYHFPRDVRFEQEPHLRERSWVYRTSGWVILLCMIAMAAYLFLLGGQWKRSFNDFNFLLWMESIAVWSFAAAWLAKGRVIIAEIAVDVLAHASKLVLDDRRPDDPLPTSEGWRRRS
ncbi:hypothetical protein NZK35_24200 [Stieleria sp. ICT_E10.1]|uniref:hypothetical protein n=1 Tax=Stieleria sedimenti TaxID=2976331 RepID=UPI00217FCDD8|nr:hypothetical protein [Stieleria sedimenti]MCS7469766.1 hypothetical protein [Stieleria sedimenti]